MFSTRDAGDLRRHGAHYDVTVMVHVENVFERDIYNDIYSLISFTPEVCFIGIAFYKEDYTNPHQQ